MPPIVTDFQCLRHRSTAGNQSRQRRRACGVVTWTPAAFKHGMSSCTLRGAQVAIALPLN